MWETWETEANKTSNNIFSATMSFKRFQFIHKFITFDDKSTHNDRWKSDKYAYLCELFEIMNKQNQKRQFPSPLLTLDETLHLCWEVIGFKQYNPKKNSEVWFAVS